jgi:peptide/nickel transport system permease protein
VTTIAAQPPGAQPIDPSSMLPDRPRTLWRDAWGRIKRDKTALTCLGILIVYILVGLFGFSGVMERKIAEPVGGSNEPPKFYKVDADGKKTIAPALWIGTDIFNRSVMWRILYGVRVAMTVAFLAALVETIVGFTLGAIGGYFGGWIDAFVIWLFSTVASVPWILLMIALAYVLQGQSIPAPWTEAKEIPMAGIPTIVLALGLTSWVGLCRLIRAEVLKHRERDYVVAARAMGLGHIRIIFKHIFPNVFHIVIINFSLGLAAYVQSEVVLSFLGLGVTNKPSWGRMIDDAKLELLKGVWWQMAAATTAIFIFSLAVNLFGDALRDALDPRLRGTD